MADAPLTIVGAGPAGSIAALFLAQKGYPVTVLEKAPAFPRDKVCGDALSGKVGEVFRKLWGPTAWETFSQEPFVMPSWGISFFSHQGHGLRLPFSDKPLSAAPGCIAARKDFDAYLHSKLTQCEGITLRLGMQVRGIERTLSGWLLHTNQGPWRTNYLVGADGAQSVIARYISPIAKKHIYVGLRLYMQNIVYDDPENFLELHFLKELLPGYFWIFPQVGGRFNVGLGIRAAKVSHHRLHLRALLQELLHSPRWKARFEKALPLEMPQGFPIPLWHHPKKLVGPGIALLGDAAQLVDPFTGEGIGNALLSGMYWAQSFVENASQTPLSQLILEAYPHKLYHRLGSELRLSRWLQKLITVPGFFDWFIRKVLRSPSLRNALSQMYHDVKLRTLLRQPGFYWSLLWS
ncbi:MAG: NAD(P)/FAD-dependent oxidoreductase [Bacteroidia bacterium]